VKNEKFKGTIRTKKIELLGNVHSPIRNFLFGDSSKEGKASIIRNIFHYIIIQIEFPDNGSYQAF